MSKKFIKNKEDFICEKCGEKVKGNGYTNHCPECLWSKHVDLFPGDRKSLCLSLMEPIIIESVKGKYRVTHQCIQCFNRKINNLGEKDNMAVAISITEKKANKFYLQ